MNMAWTIGTFFRIPVKLHITMLILPLLTFSRMPVAGFFDAVLAFALIVLLFGSVLLHELGHALTARRYGIDTQDIILTPIGGIARIVGLPKKPRHEIIIAVAGPFVSLALAGISFTALVVFAAMLPILPENMFNILTYASVANLMLGLFNLIPALPMDGGRILRGFLSLNRDYLIATQIAAKTGRILAVVGAILAIFWLESWSLALISAFVYLNAGAEVRMAAIREYQKKRPSKDPDWSSPPHSTNRDVVVIKGGKVEIISRKDPDDE